MIKSNAHLWLDDFAEIVLGANDSLRQNGFKQWLFYPGMAFNTKIKWWGDFGTRDFPHEGVDFCLYEGSDGRVFHFKANSVIPVIEDGAVRAVFKNYLGHAIIVEHGQWPGSEKPLLSIYAHTIPLPMVEPGLPVDKGSVIATTTDTRNAKAKILSHLHFSLGLASPDLFYENFYWNLIREPVNVELLDPLEVVQVPYHQPRKRIPERF